MITMNIEIIKETMMNSMVEIMEAMNKIIGVMMMDVVKGILAMNVQTQVVHLILQINTLSKRGRGMSTGSVQKS